MELDQVITAVRKETGIKLNAADPVLASAAINAVLLDDALAQMDHSMNAAVAKFTVLGGKNEEAARRVASELINSAADWLGNQFKEAAKEATAEMLAELRQETAKAEAAAERSRKFAFWSGAIAAGSLSLILGYGLAGL